MLRLPVILNPRIIKLPIVPPPKHLLQTSLYILRHLIDTHPLLVIPNEIRIPQLTGDSQILAAPYQRVGFDSFRRSGEARIAEIVLLASSLGHKSAVAVEGVFASKGCVEDGVCGFGNQTPPSRSKRAVEDAAVFDFGEVDHSI